MKYFAFFSILVFSMLISCGKKAVEDSSELSNKMDKNILIPKGVKLLYTLGGDSTHIFYQISDFYVDQSTDQIIILDKGIFQIQIFDSNGTLIRVAGTKGAGPGEFSNPSRLAVTRNFIYVSELLKPIIHQFDRELNFIKDINTNDLLVVRIAPCQKENLLITGMTIDDREFIAGILNPQVGKFHENSFPISLDYSFIEHERSPFAKLWDVFLLREYDNNFFAMFEFRNKILSISNQNEILWQKSIDGIPPYSEPIGKSLMMRPVRKIFRDMTIDEDGTIYILSGNVGSYHGNEVIMLDKMGNHIETLFLPYKANSIRWTKKNLLYTVGLDRIHIYCYEITSKK